MAQPTDILNDISLSDQMGLTNHPEAEPPSAGFQELAVNSPEQSDKNFFEMSASEQAKFTKEASPPPGPPPDAQQAASAQMLLKAAEQQRRLAAMLPDDGGEMLALAEQQERQANAILGGTTSQPPPPREPERVASTAYYAPSDAAPPPPPPPPQPPAPPSHVTAVLRRDSQQLFKLLLKESPGGVLISRLLPSDAEGDERSKLREGDIVRTINGLGAYEMPIDQLKAYVRDCPGALYVEVERLEMPPMSAFNDAMSAEERFRARFGNGGGGGPGGSRQAAPAENDLDALLGNVTSNVKNGLEDLKDQFSVFMQRDVPELQQRAEVTREQLASGELTARLGTRAKEIGEQAKVFGEQAKETWRDLLDAGKETSHDLAPHVEKAKQDLGHGLKQLGDGWNDWMRQLSEPQQNQPHASVGPGSAFNTPRGYQAPSGNAAYPGAAGRGGVVYGDNGTVETPRGRMHAAIGPGSQYMNASPGGTTVQAPGAAPPRGGEEEILGDEEFNEATQLAIALSLSEKEAGAAKAAAPEAAAAEPLIPLGEDEAAATITVAPPPAQEPPPQPQQLVDVSDGPALTDSEQLAMAMSLSLEEAEKEKEREAEVARAEIKMVARAAASSEEVAALPAAAPTTAAAVKASPLFDEDL